MVEASSKRCKEQSLWRKLPKERVEVGWVGKTTRASGWSSEKVEYAPREQTKKKAFIEEEEKLTKSKYIVKMNLNKNDEWAIAFVG